MLSADLFLRISYFVCRFLNCHSLYVPIPENILIRFLIQTADCRLDLLFAFPELVHFLGDFRLKLTDLIDAPLQLVTATGSLWFL